MTTTWGAQFYSLVYGKKTYDMMVHHPSIIHHHYPSWSTNECHYVSLTITGWWFGCHLFSQKYWVSVIIPIDELHHFSEGWLNHQPVLVGKSKDKMAISAIAMKRQRVNPHGLITMEISLQASQNHRWFQLENPMVRWDSTVPRFGATGGFCLDNTRRYMGWRKWDGGRNLAWKICLLFFYGILRHKSTGRLWLDAFGWWLRRLR